MSKGAVVFGYSGHSYVILEILKSNKYSLLGYYDNECKEKNPFGLKYLGSEKNDVIFEDIQNYSAFLGIGNNNIRAELFKKLINKKISCPIVAHKKSIISPLAEIGYGTVVMAGAVINTLVKVGNAVICNSSSVIEHECIVGDYSHISCGAVLAGNVIIGENTFIGANSVIRQNLTIGANVIVGAGAVVTKDISDNAIVYGNPAKNRI